MKFLSDKEQLTSHISNADTALKIKRCLDIAQRSVFHFDEQATFFLSPENIVLFRDIADKISELKYKIDGGIDEFERAIFVFTNENLDFQEEFLSFIKLQFNLKFKKISHRDILGATLGLGISRDFIGDIILLENEAYIVCLKTIAPYIEQNLTQVGRTSVAVSIVQREDVKHIVPEVAEKIFTVPSLRIDKVVAGVFNLSGTKAQEIISQGRVSLNHALVIKPSEKVKDNSIISVRGLGKVRFKHIISETSKGKWRVLCFKYV